MAATPTWDPHQYLRHAAHRARPFADLLAQVTDLPADPARIADLGCGPGNVTVQLAERWPTAHITGYDNSAEMLAEAQEHAGPTPGGGRLDFAHADLTDWTPTETYDLIASNAALQWVPGHLEALPGWLDALAPGGTLAVQMPDNIDAPLRPHARPHAAPPAGRPASRASCAPPTPSTTRSSTWTASKPSAAPPTSGRPPTCNS